MERCRGCRPYRDGIRALVAALLAAAAVVATDASATERVALTGFVTDAAGRPLAATVRASGSNALAWTDPDGRFALRVPAAEEAVIELTAYGFRPAALAVDLAPNAGADVTVELAAALDSALRGQVLDATTGAGIAGAIVTVLDTPLPPAETNGAGGYGFPDIPGGTTYDVRAEADGYVPLTLAVEVPEGVTVILDFSLEPLSSSCAFAAAASAGGLGSPPDALRQVRDAILLRSDAGRALVDGFYTHSPEVTGLLLRDPELLARAAAVVGWLESAARATFAAPAGDAAPGSRVLITESVLPELERLLDDLTGAGSRELGAYLERVRELVRAHRGWTIDELVRAFGPAARAAPPPRGER